MDGLKDYSDDYFLLQDAPDKSEAKPGYPYFRRAFSTRKESIRLPSYAGALTLLSVAFHTLLPKTDFFDNDYAHSGEKAAEALLAYLVAYSVSKLLFTSLFHCLGKAFCTLKTIRESLPARNKANDEQKCANYIEISTTMWRGMTYLFFIPTMLNPSAIRLTDPVTNFDVFYHEEKTKKYREDPVLCNKDISCRAQTLFALASLFCFTVAGGTAYAYTHFYLDTAQTLLQDYIHLNESWSEDASLALIPTAAVSAYFTTKAIIALSTAFCIVQYCNRGSPAQAASEFASHDPASDKPESFGHHLRRSPLAGTNLQEFPRPLHNRKSDGSISLGHMPSVQINEDSSERLQYPPEQYNW